MGSVVFAFLLIMVAGGFIAYFGDRLGYVMGKKRLTLFGLRPRHTATALTVIAGVVIGALALAFLIGVNQAFRVALLTGEREIRLNLHLSRSNLRLASEANRNRLAALVAVQAAGNASAQAQLAKAGLAQAERDLNQQQTKAALIEQQLVAKQDNLTSLTATLSTEQKQLAAVQAAVRAAESDRQLAVAAAFQFLAQRRNGSLIYRKFGELGRTVISASEPQPQIHSDLLRFLNILSQQATARGASVGPNGRAVVLASALLSDDKSSKSNDFVLENGLLDALANSIHSFGSGEVVVVASALGNSFDKSQVIIFLRPYANVLVIKAGTEIAETVISGASTSVDDIAGQFQNFLVTQVRPAATQAGVIPVKNPMTGADELGDVSLDQIYDVVSEVRLIEGPAKIIAYAANNVYSADQLKLNFTVDPDNESPH